MAVSVQLKKGETYGISTRDRAKFGWLSVEGVDLPYIVRDGREKFIPVKMVEQYILSFYPSTYPKELQDKPPLVCTFMKQDECDLLNKCCGKRAGFVDKFAKTDPVVKLNDFLQFFGFVKSTYPDVVIGVVTPHQSQSQQPPQPQSQQAKAPAPAPDTDSGWVLVKDAMIPYVLRGVARYAPINVIRGAAQMLVGVQVDTTVATESEVLCLNAMCQKVGLVFTFQANTCLTNLRLLKLHDPQCVIRDLPKDNPMDYVNSTAAAKGKPANGNHVVRNQGSGGQRGGVGPVATGAGAQRPSASKSLQALANMAKGQAQVSPGHSPPQGVRPANSQQTSKASANTGALKNGPVVNRPPGTVVTKPTAASAATKPSAIIQPMECHGKTISCLIRGRASQAFALVEAVCRVYFPNSSLVDFIHFMEMDLAVTLYVLKKSEEDAFIEFYGIPTKQLRCNQVIKLKDLRDRMPRLVARFGANNPSLSLRGPGSVGSRPDSRGSSVHTDMGNDGPDVEFNPIHSVLDSADISPADSPASGSDVTQSEGQGRKTRSLESTIMRILDKKQGNENEMESDNSVLGTKEIVDEAESDKEQEQPSKVQPTNKRKATPRRCTPQKKLTLIIDGVRTEIEENSSAGTEDSDMEEYP